jgi:metallo-beta-lactamase family protein
VSDLVQLMDEGALPRIPIYVDSPLATRATRVFVEHAAELEGGAGFAARLGSRDLHFTESVADSMALDRIKGFHIVIAASGMCEAGRIRHRLRNWLWRDTATVLLVGFQAVGTLGRILQDGATSVRIQGEDFEVRARIRSIDLYSGHADGPGLLAWVRARLPLRYQIFLVHGEPEAIEGLAARLCGVVAAEDILVPTLDESFVLAPGGALRPAGTAAPRISPDKVARMDWHNDLSRLMLEINEALQRAADDRARGVLIRRLAAALGAEAPAAPPPSPDRRHRRRRR